MALERSYRRLFRLGFGKRSAEEEMDEEIDAHLRLSAEEFVRRGATPEEARRMAEARFGDLGQARTDLRAGAREREVHRRQRDTIGALLSDLRFAFTQIRRSPGFSALAILTLALGIGLTTATFSLVNGVLLQPLPLQQPDQLVALQSRDSAGSEIEVVSAGNVEDWRRSSRALEDAAYYMGRPMSVGLDAGMTRISGQLVSASFFEVVRPTLLLGRGLTAQEVEDQAGVTVVSEALWLQLGADSTLAKPLRLEGQQVQVVGVVRAGSEYPAGTALWAGVVTPPETGAMRNNVNWLAVGRLKQGVTLEQARTDLDRVAREIRERIPEGIYSFGVGVKPLVQYVARDSDRMLRLLMLAVAGVLLVACANLAAANLGRGAGRSREFAVRVALGAGRLRLIQQVLIEQGCLALLGGAIGSWLGWIGVRSILVSWASQIPRADEVTFDLRVLAFAIVVSVIAGVVAGIAPALRSSQVSPYAVMSSGTRSASGGRGLPGAWLIAGEIALALTLLTGAGLLVRSFRQLLARDVGFRLSVVTAEAGLSRADFGSPDAAAQYWSGVVRELGTLPGVQSVGVATWIPMGAAGRTFIEVSGRSGTGEGAGYRIVGGDYFPALGISLRGGRLFDARDSRDAPRTVVINQEMAEKFWPGEDPIGRQVRALSMERAPDGTSPWLTVIGVVSNVRHWGMEDEVDPEMYVEVRQVPQWAYGMTAVVRGSGPANELVSTVRNRLRELNPNVGFVMGTLQERMDRSLANRRFVMSVLTGFSVLALVLASIGLYAVLSYSITRRTRELAVRSALGATRGQLVRLVFGNAARVVLTGAVIGLGGSMVLGWSMRVFLVEIEPFDPITLSGSVLVLFAVSALAVLVPARRATRTHPATALQSE